MSSMYTVHMLGGRRGEDCIQAYMSEHKRIHIYLSLRGMKGYSKNSPIRPGVYCHPLGRQRVGGEIVWLLVVVVIMVVVVVGRMQVIVRMLI